MSYLTDWTFWLAVVAVSLALELGARLWARRPANGAVTLGEIVTLCERARRVMVGTVQRAVEPTGTIPDDATGRAMRARWEATMRAVTSRRTEARAEEPAEPPWRAKPVDTPAATLIAAKFQQALAGDLERIAHAVNALNAPPGRSERTAELWSAIYGFTEACGGNTGTATIDTPRTMALVDVEAALDEILAGVLEQHRRKYDALCAAYSALSDNMRDAVESVPRELRGPSVGASIRVMAERLRAERDRILELEALAAAPPDAPRTVVGVWLSDGPGLESETFRIYGPFDSTEQAYDCRQRLRRASSSFVVPLRPAAEMEREAQESGA